MDTNPDMRILPITVSSSGFRFTLVFLVAALALFSAYWFYTDNTESKNHESRWTEKRPGETDEPAADTWHQNASEILELARQHIRFGRFDDAERTAQQLLGDLAPSGNPRTLLAAKAIDVLVEAQWKKWKGKSEDVVDLAHAAILTKKQLLGPDHPEVTASQIRLANLSIAIGNCTEAAALLKHSLRIVEKAEGPDSGMSAILFALGRLHHLCLTRYRQGAAYYTQSLGILEQDLGPHILEIGEVLESLGTALWQGGDNGESRRVLERSLQIRRQSLDSDNPLIASSLIALGQLSWYNADYSQAQVFYQQARSKLEKNFPPDHPQVARVLKRIGDNFSFLGNYEAALPLLDRALSIEETVHGPEHPDVAESLELMTRTFIFSGEYAKAKAYAERALTLTRTLFGPDNLHVGESKYHLGIVSFRMGELDTARDFLEESLHLYESILPRHVEIAWILKPLALLYFKIGEYRLAFDASLRADKIFRDDWLKAASELSEREALNYVAGFSEAPYITISLAVSRFRDNPEVILAAWDTVSRSRALVANEMAARKRSQGIRPAPTDLSGTAFEKIRLAIPADVALVAFSRYSHYEVTETDQEGEGESGEFGPRAIHNPAYVAFVLSGSADKRPALVPIGSAVEIEPLIASVQQHIRQESQAGGRSSTVSERGYRAAATKLRERIWDPVADLVQAETVLVIPDGMLNFINFSALPNDESGYLIESGPRFHYLSAERDILEIRENRESGVGLLMLDGPAYDEEPPEIEPDVSADSSPSSYSSVCEGNPPFIFQPLPATETEADEIIGLWKRAKTAKDERMPNPGLMRLKGQLATEANLRLEAPGRQVVHLATHGFFITERCTLAAAAENGADLAGSPATAMEINPLFLSGLALTGANRRFESGDNEHDGILTAAEVAALDLRGVEWVVLSGCDTGIGRVQSGEGVLGLRRAFHVAGVHTLIMSLWAVEDQTALEWMTRLYQNHLIEELGTAQSVQQASLDTLRARRSAALSTHPFYWAGFVATGQWR